MVEDETRLEHQESLCQDCLYVLVANPRSQKFSRSCSLTRQSFGCQLCIEARGFERRHLNAGPVITKELDPLRAIGLKGVNVVQESLTRKGCWIDEITVPSIGGTGPIGSKVWYRLSNAWRANRASRRAR